MVHNSKATKHLKQRHEGKRKEEVQSKDLYGDLWSIRIF